MCVSIKLWFRKPLAQVRFKSNSESRYLIKVSAVKFRKKTLFVPLPGQHDNKKHSFRNLYLLWFWSLFL